MRRPGRGREVWRLGWEGEGGVLAEVGMEGRGGVRGGGRGLAETIRRVGEGSCRGWGGDSGLEASGDVKGRGGAEVERGGVLPRY